MLHTLLSKIHIVVFFQLVIPDFMRRLETLSTLGLIVTLSQQQTREANVLNSDSAWEASRQGMSDWDILQNAGIDTSLKITI